jgi:hypothetical protein
MRKIHPGITAIAILMGPACLIIGHQNVSESLSLLKPISAEPIEVLQKIYQTCSEPPRLQRTVRCDEFVRYFDGCAVKKRCDLRASYEFLIKLDFAPPPFESLPIDKVAATKS